MYNPENESELLKKLYKVAEEKKSDPIKSSDDVILKVLNLRKKKVEYVAFLLLDNGNNVIKKITSKGTVNQNAVYPREIAKACLLNDAVSVIMAHNHPGGADTFSESDILITNKLKECLKLFEINLLDHIIIYGAGHKSIRKTHHWF